MTYTPLAVILLVLVLGAAVTLTVLFRASRTGHFRNLKAGAYVIFDEDEPVGEPQDQILHRDAARDATRDATRDTARDANGTGDDDSGGRAGDAAASDAAR